MLLRKLFSWFRRVPPTSAIQPSTPFYMPNVEYGENCDVSYEIRAVAFIDILGWGKAVEDSVASPELRKKLLNAVWALNALTKNDVEEETPEHSSLDRATQFSDSVVVSIPFAGHLDLVRLIRQITSYQHSMLMLGLPLRGGIAVGPLYHAGALVFGPALNEAYHLENKVASYPRVIIAKSLDPKIEMAAGSMPRHLPFVVNGDDGFYSTDFLAMYARSYWSANEIDQKIDHWLSIHRGDERTYKKYVWLKSQWDATKGGIRT